MRQIAGQPKLVTKGQAGDVWDTELESLAAWHYRPSPRLPGRLGQTVGLPGNLVVRSTMECPSWATSDLAPEAKFRMPEKKLNYPAAWCPKWSQYPGTQGQVWDAQDTWDWQQVNPASHHWDQMWDEQKAGWLGSMMSEARILTAGTNSLLTQKHGSWGQDQETGWITGQPSSLALKEGQFWGREEGQLLNPESQCTRPN